MGKAVEEGRPAAVGHMLGSQAVAVGSLPLGVVAAEDSRAVPVVVGR